MRVITGRYKGRHFEVPSSFKARPTTDFAKENLFNVLRAYVDFEGISVLDLFAGTGSISLEFLSRGCSEVLSVEKDALHCRFIRTVMQKLGDLQWHLAQTDALLCIQKSTRSFDLVFADPPYALREIGELPDRVMKSQLLQPEGLFVLEHGNDHSFAEHPNLVDHRTYGSVNFSLFIKK